jgi:hypothetical protein
MIHGGFPEGAQVKRVGCTLPGVLAGVGSLGLG